MKLHKAHIHLKLLYSRTNKDIKTIIILSKINDTLFQNKISVTLSKLKSINKEYDDIKELINELELHIKKYPEE
jgi:hypothetical protein